MKDLLGFGSLVLAQGSRRRRIYILKGVFFLLFVGTQARAQLSGRVFYDFNLNGVLDGAEVGVKGVRVTAFVEGSATPLSVQTAADGTYSISIAPSKKVRVEFSNWPLGSHVAPVDSSGITSVQFVETPRAEVSLRLIDPRLYTSTTNLRLATSCFITGDVTSPTADSGLMPSLIQFPYSASGQGQMPTPIAVAQSTGSVWGMVYHRQAKQLFTSASLRRHSGLGPLGLGGIYKSDLREEDVSTESYLNLGRFVRLISPQDSVLLAARSLPSDFGQPSTDSLVFGLVGKVGIGGITLSPDEKTLWAVNLYEKTLVRVQIGAPVKEGSQLTAADISSIPLPDPGCVGGQARPWAVQYYQGALYVGLTCDGSASGATRNALRAYVYRFDLAAQRFEPTPVVSIALDYRKGWAHVVALQSEYWETWSDEWSDYDTSFLTAENNDTIFRISRPQAILSDLVFDHDGSMIVGLMDRLGLQMGRNQPDIQATANSLYSGYTGGDILRLHKNTIEDTYSLEQNGVAGDRTGCGVENGQGPGGGEFYCAEQYSSEITGESINQETFMGSLLLLPNQKELVASVVQPFTSWSSGLLWMSNSNGSRVKAYELKNSNPFDPSAPTLSQYVGITNSLGAMTVLERPAPIQLGGRVWLDQNKNGVQDPEEAGLAQVNVALYDTIGNRVATQKTNDQGFYSFGGDGLGYAQEYYVSFEVNMDQSRFTNTTDQLTVEGVRYRLSPANLGEGNTPHLNDSDASIATDLPLAFLNGYPVIRVRVGGAGESNFTYAMGLSSCAAEAGDDITRCLSAGPTLQLRTPLLGQTWTVKPNNQGVTVTNDGAVSGLVALGVFTFYLTDGACSDSLRVHIVSPPTRVATARQVSCVNGQPLSNGQIILQGFDSTDRFDIAMGSQFTSGIYGSPQPVPTGGVLLAGMENPSTPTQDFTVRVYSAGECVQDVVVTLIRRDCSTAGSECETSCAPVIARVIRTR